MITTLFDALDKLGWPRDDIADVLFTVDGDICFTFSSPYEPDYSLSLGIALYWEAEMGDTEAHLWLELAHIEDGSLKVWGIDCPLDITEIDVILRNHKGNEKWQQD
jgi:hypothetical protein